MVLFGRESKSLGNFSRHRGIFRICMAACDVKKRVGVIKTTQVTARIPAGHSFPADIAAYGGKPAAAGREQADGAAWEVLTN
jgi:hypothetical protein